MKPESGMTLVEAFAAAIEATVAAGRLDLFEQLLDELRRQLAKQAARP